MTKDNIVAVDEKPETGAQQEKKKQAMGTEQDAKQDTRDVKEEVAILADKVGETKVEDVADSKQESNEEASEELYGVVVYVYDLSHGMASTYAPMFLGIDLDAIYHTSVVVYSKEYYIDQGIKTCFYPGNTKYGMPIDIIDLGQTFVNEEVFNEFINDLNNHEKQKYHAANYDLWDNNCNHFTDVCVEFLTGKNLDNKILKLPQAVLDSPNGQLLKSLIGSRVNP